MKKTLIGLLPYLLVLAADFYLLPRLIGDTGSAMLIMLCVMPLIAFICSLIYGVLHSFNILLPVLTAILFASTVPIYYNDSALIYILAYAIAALAGNGIGKLFYNKR